MALRDTTESWGSVSKFFHWTIALLVILMLIMGPTMGWLPKSYKYTVYQLHKSCGLTILLLMLLRAAWRSVNATPKLPDHLKSWQKMAAKWSHWSLYILLILMPISGWVMSTAAGKTTSFWFLFSINAPWVHKSKPLASFASDSHTALAWLILIVLVVHIGAALHHHFVNKDHVFKRMWLNRA